MNHFSRPTQTSAPLLHRLGGALADALLPTCCVGCSGWVETGPLGLCVRCRSALRPLEGRRCHTCLTLRIADSASHCLRCLAKPRVYHRLHALYDYRPPFDRVVQALKFRRMAYLAEAFAEQAWDRFADELASAHVVVPVPLPWQRRLQRGFNQSAVFADRLAILLGRPTATPLMRRGLTLQSSLETEGARRRNARQTLLLKNASARAVRAIRRKRVLLVDDLVTSGATADRAAQLLQRAGARHVVVLAAGHRQ